MTIFSMTDYAAIAFGDVDGYTPVQVVGRNANVGTSLIDIWGPNIIIPWGQAAVTVEAFSTSANDTPAGTGAQKIVVFGLDDTLSEAPPTILDMNGTSPTTATTQTFRRINRVAVFQSGVYADSTTGSNDGGITVRISGGGVTMAFIEPNQGASLDAKFTIPSGKEAFIAGGLVNISSGDNAAISFWQRTGADTTSAPYDPKRIVVQFDGLTGGQLVPLPIPSTVIDEKTDLWASAKASGPNTAVNILFTLLMRDK